MSRRWLENAEELLNKAQLFTPDLPEYFSTFSRLQLIKFMVFGEGSIESALDVALQGCSKYPYFNEINMIIGYCYYLQFGRSGNQSDLSSALEHSERGFWSYPQKVTNIVYPELLLLNREYEKALEICRIMVPSDASLIVRFKLGKILYYMGRLADSKALFDQFISPIEYRVAAQFYLGMIAAQENDLELAEKIVKELQVLTPDLFGDYLLLASICYGIKKEELGWKYIKKFFEDGHAERAMKHIFLRQIELDRNFDGVLDLEKLNSFLDKGDVG
jgi:hypothetical protein